ncbi:Cytochrome c [Aquisphaera giovannonii]|uniref:Cytochrome c n=1 Tax=Aquisphaera giovannonii TaxID=406548 RepID=A0A5B9WB56_9BACT|nr:di-heme oxidoredictase family protein [Aquisphaera giovannonii]QEH37489.1 Cytochrome c [Aquisphaera giovannonii]
MDGRELFERVWAVNDPRGHGGDGLGPVFNARSCVECHDRGGTGGGGLAGRNIDVATVGVPGDAGGGFFYSFSMNFGGDGFQYRFGYDPTAAGAAARSAGDRAAAAAAAAHPGFLESPSVVLHRFGVDPSYQAWRATVPGPHGTLNVAISQRNPTPLFGAGLIESIPDEAILAAARRRNSQSRGRVSRVEGGRIGRFGWKAQAATLAEFVRSAASGELGLEVPGRRQADDPRLPGGLSPGLDMDEADCEALTRFVRDLPRPVAFAPAAAKEAIDVEEGSRAFRSIGCAVCHLPRLGDVDGLYSDLLLHDMGPDLSDVGGYAVFGAGPLAAPAAAAPDPARADRPDTRAREWRTPPLWGLRDSGPYLHDGRAATVSQAILLHGGQGLPSAERFARLSARRRRQVEAFLMTLSAPARPAG